METLIPQEIREKTESINIEQDNKKYQLNMKIKREELTLILSDPDEILSHTKKITLDEIKVLCGFNNLESCEQFCDFIKKLI